MNTCPLPQGHHRGNSKCQCDSGVTIDFYLKRFAEAGALGFQGQSTSLPISHKLTVMKEKNNTLLFNERLLAIWYILLCDTISQKVL